MPSWLIFPDAVGLEQSHYRQRTRDILNFSGLTYHFRPTRYARLSFALARIAAPVIWVFNKEIEMAQSLPEIEKDALRLSAEDRARMQLEFALRLL